MDISKLCSIASRLKGIQTELSSLGMNSTAKSTGDVLDTVTGIVELLQKRQYALQHPDECYKVQFCHDLEDGWLVLDFPNGDTKEYNHWGDIAKMLPRDAAVMWMGSTHYMSSDFDKETKIWIKP